MPKRLSREDVISLARLARLRLNDDEIDRFVNELSAILEYVEILGDVDTSGLEPTNQVTGLTNVTRPDELDPNLVSPAELMKNLPGTHNGHIKVKRMIN